MSFERGVMHQLGEIYQLRFERDLKDVPALVWRSIASPQGLATWFPARVDWDYVVGGTIHFDMPGPRGMITAIDEPHTVAFMWGEEMLRFEILERPRGSRLVFSHTLAQPDPAKFAAGWQICLDTLESHINGTAQPLWSRWQIAYELYSDDFSQAS